VQQRIGLLDAGHWANYETGPVVNAARLEMLGAIPPPASDGTQR
jgi:hypothetical protein